MKLNRINLTYQLSIERITVTSDVTVTPLVMYTEAVTPLVLYT